MNEAQFANNYDVTGFGAHTSQEVAELQKALSISQNYGSTAPNSLTGGSALAVESLDRTLKLVTNSVEHLRLWKDIGKEKVDQEVFEYNVQNSYGQEVSPFFQMGEIQLVQILNIIENLVCVSILVLKPKYTTILP